MGRRRSASRPGPGRPGVVGSAVRGGGAGLLRRREMGVVTRLLTAPPPARRARGRVPGGRVTTVVGGRSLGAWIGFRDRNDPATMVKNRTFRDFIICHPEWTLGRPGPAGT